MKQWEIYVQESHHDGDFWKFLCIVLDHESLYLLESTLNQQDRFRFKVVARVVA
jgi:hypothetical protein